MDRTKEHLCAGDISKARLKLLNAARALREKGTPPPGARDPGVYRVRGAFDRCPQRNGLDRGR
jgi:hypothetical protein